jgi:hypothetical protein
MFVFDNGHRCLRPAGRPSREACRAKKALFEFGLHDAYRIDRPQPITANFKMASALMTHMEERRVSTSIWSTGSAPAIGGDISVKAMAGRFCSAMFADGTSSRISVSSGSE